MCESLIMRTRLPMLVVGIGASSTLLTACASGASGGASAPVSGTLSAESGGLTASGTEDCGDNPEFNIDAHNIAGGASQAGVGAYSTPVDALHAVLTRGSMPYLGGSGGSGVVGMGYPAAGWTEVSATGASATFQAPLHSGTAKLTFTRVDSRWLLSHAEKDC